MKLEQAVADVAFLDGMGVWQDYGRLGVATEPKAGGGRNFRHRLPVHLLRANWLVRSLKRRPGQSSEGQAEPTGTSCGRFTKKCRDRLRKYLPDRWRRPFAVRRVLQVMRPLPVTR